MINRVEILPSGANVKGCLMRCLRNLVHMRVELSSLSKTVWQFGQLHPYTRGVINWVSIVMRG